MNVVARSFAVVCVVGAGAGFFSAALGVLAGSVASAAAADTVSALTGAGLPLAHLLAAVAVVTLSISALRMIGDIQPRERLREIYLDSDEDEDARR